jgi:hypothetical protein
MKRSYEATAAIQVNSGDGPVQSLNEVQQLSVKIGVNSYGCQHRSLCAAQELRRKTGVKKLYKSTVQTL